MSHPPKAPELASVQSPGAHLQDYREPSSGSLLMGGQIGVTRGHPKSLGQSREMRLTSGHHLCCLYRCTGCHPGPPLPAPVLCDPLATEQPGEPKKNNSDRHSAPYNLPWASRRPQHETGTFHKWACMASPFNLTCTLHLTHCSAPQVPGLSPDTPSSSVVARASA